MRSWTGECSRAFTDWYGPTRIYRATALRDESEGTDHEWVYSPPYE
jgi:hypothetical protein